MVEQGYEMILDVQKMMDAIVQHGNNCGNPNCHLNEICSKVFDDIVE